MTTTQARRRAGKRRNLPWIVGLAAVAAAASYTNASFVSFDPWIAPIKFAIGLLHFIVIGFSCSTLLGLPRSRTLHVAQDALFGQVVCVGYLYVRSMLSDGLGLPGVSLFETFTAEAVLVCLAWVKRPDAVRWTAPNRQHAAVETGIHLLWLGWLFAIAIRKLDLYFTPSSDPDIHAYYAKYFLEHGRIYYDLLPNSDATMVYPSGFGVLNLALGRLSGLHPVQLVNIGAYFQFALFAGASFSLLASRWALSAAKRCLLAAVHFAFAYGVFNPVVVEQRAYLEGTPRLAHTAMLFFPLLFAAQQRRALRDRRWLWSIPAVAAALGICINPAHAPAALCVATLALLAFGIGRGRPAGGTRRTVSHLTGAVLAISIALAITASQDPFYRSLAAQQLDPTGAIEPATDLTGGAVFGEAHATALVSQAASAAVRVVLGAPDAQRDGEPPYRAFLAAFVLAMMLVSTTKSRSEAPGVEYALRIALGGIATVLVHGVWTGLLPQAVHGGGLQARLLVQYTSALQDQIVTLFLGLTPMLAICMLLQSKRQPEGDGRSLPIRTLFALTGLALIAGSVSPLRHGIEHPARGYAALRQSPLGEVAAPDAEFARRLRDYVAPEERVLLPGRVRRTPEEHWILTTDSARAVPLFSDVRTSFFLGLDGSAFTAEAFDAHVKPPNFDPAWLRAHETIWLVESGNFPTRILNRNYDRIAGTDRAVLWKLRDAVP